MRISDWSSDVCSSDLPTVSAIGLTTRIAAGVPSRLLPPWLETESPETPASTARLASSMRHTPLSRNGLPPEICCHCSRIQATSRSEEHTSEHQSLMRISYAVFFLTQKNINHTESTSLHKAT